MCPVPRRTIVPIWLAALGLLAGGCAQPGPLARRHTTIGTLKASVVQLEGEKEQYRRRVAELEAENTRMAADLTQERAFSSDLATRLDDARQLLDRRGLAADPSFYDAPRSTAPSDWDDPSAAPSRSQPVTNPTRPGRKAPFAQIGGSLHAVPYPEESEPPARPATPPPAPAAPPARFGPQSRQTVPDRWLPVADTTASEPATSHR